MGKGKRKRLIQLKKILANNERHIPKDVLNKKYKTPYERLKKEIANCEKELGA